MALLLGYATSILLLFIPVLAAQENAAEWKKPDQSVFVVTQNHYAQGYSRAEGPTPRFGDLIMIEILSAGDAGYKLGQQYPLYSGGASVGRVKIEKVAPLECNSSAAMVSVDGSFRFSKETMALATNTPSIRAHASVKRPATETERSIVQRLATEEFSKNGVSLAPGANIEIQDLVTTAIGRSSETTLIAYLSVALKDARHEVLLIVGSQSGIEMSRNHKTTDLDDGKDSNTLRFVDQLDLDGDGTDEVVLEVTGYESDGFEIHKRQNGRWTRVWVGGQGGC